MLPEHEIEAPGHTTPPPPVLLDDPLDALLLPPVPAALDALDALLLPPALDALDALLPPPALDALPPPDPPAPPTPPVDDVLADEAPVDELDALPPPPPPLPLPCELLHPTAPRMAVTTSVERVHEFDIFEILLDVFIHETRRRRAEHGSLSSLAVRQRFFDPLFTKLTEHFSAPARDRGRRCDARLRAPDRRMKKLAIITSHPIPYNAPWFRHIAAEPGINLEVVYLAGFEREAASAAQPRPRGAVAETEAAESSVSQPWPNPRR